MKLLFTNWALVLVWCHFVACSNMAMKCFKLINCAFVLVWCHFWGALGLYLGCCWIGLGLPLGCPGLSWARFRIDSIIKPY